jgi:antitoxin component YwqK of YwqJK toxin-antitoxin module
MTLLHDAYVALLSGLTTKTNNEIHWQDEYGKPITIEPISVSECKYVVRYYYNSGKISKEINYHQNQRHGKYIRWHYNRIKYYETDYHQGQLHGKDIVWYDNGQKHWERDYYQGQLHGKAIRWYENGQKWTEIEYHQGQLHGKYIVCDNNGRKHWEGHYKYGKLIRKIL